MEEQHPITYVRIPPYGTGAFLKEELAHLLALVRPILRDDPRISADYAAGYLTALEEVMQLVTEVSAHD